MAKSRKKEKEVVFSSERYTKFQQYKGLLILLAVILVLIVIVAVTANIAKNVRNSWISSDENSPYAYRWKVDKKGVMTLIFDRSELPEYEWRFENSEGDAAASVEMTKKQPEDASRFNVTASEEGRSILSFGLYSGDSRKYDLNLMLDAEENEKGIIVPEIVAAGGTAVSETVQGTPSAYYSYTIGPSAEGERDLCITIYFDSGIAVSGWTCTSSNEEAAEEVGIVETKENVSAYLYPGSETGDSEILLSNEAEGVAVRCTVTRADDGALILQSHSMEGGDNAPEETADGAFSFSFEELDAVLEEAEAAHDSESAEDYAGSEDSGINYKLSPEEENMSDMLNTDVPEAEDESGE